MENSKSEAGKIDMILRQIIRMGTLFGGFTILLSTLFVTYDIVCRAFGTGSFWVDEVTVYLLVVMSFLGIGFALQSGKHVQVTFVIEKLSPAVRGILAKLVNVIIIFISLIFIFFGTQTVIDSYSLDFRSPTMLSAPLFIPLAAIPIGALLLLIEVIREFLIDFSSSERGK